MRRTHGVRRSWAIGGIASVVLIGLAFWVEARLEKRARMYQAVVRATWVSIPD